MRTANPIRALIWAAGLHVFRQASREWLEAIAFSKAQTIYFTTALSKKETLVSEYGKMFKNLAAVHEILFDYVTDDIKKHEQMLSFLYQRGKGISDWDYHEKHRVLKDKIHLFAKVFEEFKKMVFGYVKKLYVLKC